MSEQQDAIRRAKHNLGANLRMLRAYHRLTLEDVAERAGLHPDTVGDYEKERGNPRVRTIASLAYALGVNGATLLRRVDLPDLEDDET